MSYEWAIIGAGPAGIAAVGNLLDYGIPAEQIAWLDPHFTVGDFGTKWRNVPSNTKVSLFLKYLNACQSFAFQDCAQNFAIQQTDPEKTCHLHLMGEPLQWITDFLKTKVQIFKTLAEHLFLGKNLWHIILKNKQEIRAKKVILAMGSEPETLAFPNPVIPLEIAMDEHRLQKIIAPTDTIAVFGSSHSAILVLKNLVENNVKKIINFFRSPLLYAVHLHDWILFDDGGLKASTAEWARTNIDGELPNNLIRVHSNQHQIEKYLPQCNKVIYAIGFKRRHLPQIKDLDSLSYFEQCGIIAPGLFGCGIAFPEAKMNRLGIVEHRVGLWKFMDYIRNILPIWMAYPL